MKGCGFTCCPSTVRPGAVLCPQRLLLEAQSKRESRVQTTCGFCREPNTMKAETGWLPGNLLVLAVLGTALEPGVPNMVSGRNSIFLVLVSRSSLSFSKN